MGPGRGRQSTRYMVPLDRDSSTVVREVQKQESQGVEHGKKQGYNDELSTRTLYSREKDTLGELVVAPGNGITPRHKVDESWHINNSSGLAPASQEQILQQPQLPALCRALCDFNPNDMNLGDCKYCLAFFKGDILTVIRRLDKHWIEAKLGDQVGFFPLHYLEPNSVAAKLFNVRRQAGSESAESSCYRAESGSNPEVVPAQAPVSNAVSLPSKGKHPSISDTLYQPTKGNAAIGSLRYQAPPHYLLAPSATQGAQRPSKATSHHVKRRSDRHLSQKKMHSETPPTITMALVNPHIPSASSDNKNTSTQQLSINVCAALYSYKPRQPEELELRKGEMVGVYGSFKEGWLRGLSLRTGKIGILPCNYVTPVLRTSARLLETKAATASFNMLAGRRPTASKDPAVVLALDSVNTDGAVNSTGQIPSVPSGAQHTMSSTGTGKYGVSHGWDTVKRGFHQQRGSTERGTRYNHISYSNHPLAPLQNFARVQPTGYSPPLQRKKHSSTITRQLGCMSEPTAPSAAASILKDKELASAQGKAHQHDRRLPNSPQSILVRPESHKNNTDKPAKSVRFLTEEDSPLARVQTASWSSGNQASSAGQPGPTPLEMWAPSLTLGRDGPGMVLRDGKAPVLKKGQEIAASDFNTNLQKPSSSQSPFSVVPAQFSPSRVTTSHLAREDSELSLLQGELVLVHRPRPDGRVLVTQESSGQTGLFHSSVLQALERIS